MTNQHGRWNGRHYTEYVDTVKTLKREERLDEAVDLLGHLVDATEEEARHEGPGWGVAPWYYEQLAIIHRKNGDFGAELAILERYARQPHASGAKPPRLMARLEQARARR
jgi:hypothetical protein